MHHPPTSPHSTRRSIKTTPVHNNTSSCLLLPSSQEDPRRSKVEEKKQKTESKDTLSSSDPTITTAAETTVKGDEILVLGTMQQLLSCMRVGYWLSISSLSRTRIQEEEGPSAAGAVAGVEGTCASNPQQDCEKLKEKQEEEKHYDNSGHEEEE